MWSLQEFTSKKTSILLNYLFCVFHRAELIYLKSMPDLWASSVTFGMSYWQGCALTPQVSDVMYYCRVYSLPLPPFLLPKFLLMLYRYFALFCCMLFLFCYLGAEIRSVCTEAGMFAIRSRRKVCENKVWLFKSVLLRGSENKINVPLPRTNY